MSSLDTLASFAILQNFRSSLDSNLHDMMSVSATIYDGVLNVSRWNGNRVCP